MPDLPMTVWVAVALAFGVVALGGGRVSHWLVNHGMVDSPDQRRLNLETVPRGGGSLVALGILFALIWLGMLGQLSFSAAALSTCILAASLLGWFEDLRPRPIKWRLVGQLMIALGLMLYFRAPDHVQWGPYSWSLPAYVWGLFSILAFVWVVNLHNFMDGSDGLAALQGLFSISIYAVFYLQAGLIRDAFLPMIIGAALLGFLFWNRPPARLFMGDSGSLLIGAAVGSLAYYGIRSGAVSVVLCIMISSVFIVDATATLLRRVFKGEQWYNAHATHAFQLLVIGGLSHAQVLSVYSALNIGLVAPVVYLASKSPEHELWFVAALLVSLTIGWWQVQQRAPKLRQQQG